MYESWIPKKDPQALLAIGRWMERCDEWIRIVLSANLLKTNCEFHLKILNRNLIAGGENSIRRLFIFLRKS